MSTPKPISWIPIAALSGTLFLAALAGAVGYGTLRNQVANLERTRDDHQEKFDKAKEVLHRRISAASTEISLLKTSALMRVGTVEVRLERLNNNISALAIEAQADRNRAQETMAKILKQMQERIK